MIIDRTSSRLPVTTSTTGVERNIPSRTPPPPAPPVTNDLFTDGFDAKKGRPLVELSGASAKPPAKTLRELLAKKNELLEQWQALESGKSDKFKPLDADKLADFMAQVKDFRAEVDASEEAGEITGPNADSVRTQLDKFQTGQPMAWDTQNVLNQLYENKGSMSSEQSQAVNDAAQKPFDLSHALAANAGEHPDLKELAATYQKQLEPMLEAVRAMIRASGGKV